MAFRLKGMCGSLRDELKRRTLMVYLTAGDPYVNDEVVETLSSCGIRVFEFGIPLASPKYDGPIIRMSYKRALENGVSLEGVFSAISGFNVAHKIILTYFEYALKVGLDRIAELSLEADASGILFPDLLIDYPEELGAYIKLCSDYGLEPIFFITSSFPHKLISRLAGMEPTFIYLGLMASTGILLPITVTKTIKIVRELIDGTPLLAGFAISEPWQVSNCIRAGADGVVVGSAIIRLISETRGRGLYLEGLKEYVYSLIKALEV